MAFQSEGDDEWTGEIIDITASFKASPPPRNALHQPNTSSFTSPPPFSQTDLTPKGVKANGSSQLDSKFSNPSFEMFGAGIKRRESVPVLVDGVHSPSLTSSSNPKSKPLHQQQQQHPASRTTYNPFADPDESSSQPGDLDSSFSTEISPFNKPAANHELENIPTHVAAYDYVAQEGDELNLLRGDLIVLESRGVDGWFIGKNMCSSRFGTFPGNFLVEFETAYPTNPPLSLILTDEMLALRLQKEEELEARRAKAASMAEDQRLAYQLQREEMDAPQSQPQKDSFKGKKYDTHAHMVPEGAGDDFEGFYVRFLGSIKREAGRESEDVANFIREVIEMRKHQKVSSKRIFHLRVSPQGVSLIDSEDSSKDPIRFSLQNIATCAFDPDDPKLLGFISRDPRGTGSACHVFSFDKSAVPIANAFKRAFELASAKYVKQRMHNEAALMKKGQQQQQAHQFSNSH